MQKLNKMFCISAVVLTSARLIDGNLKENASVENWINSQTLIPYVSFSGVIKQEQPKQQKNKDNEFREENPEVTSGDEETLIDDE